MGIEVNNVNNMSLEYEKFEVNFLTPTLLSVPGRGVFLRERDFTLLSTTYISSVRLIATELATGAMSWPT